jgi:hypothetical protein
MTTKEIKELKRTDAIGRKFYAEVEEALGTVLYGYSEYEGQQMPNWGDHVPESLLDMAAAILKENPEIIKEYKQRTGN